MRVQRLFWLSINLPVIFLLNSFKLLCRSFSYQISLKNCVVTSSKEFKELLSFTLQNSRSWISEDDIYKPHLDEVSDQDEAPPSAPAAEPKGSQSPPSVVHRRQIGILPPRWERLNFMFFIHDRMGEQRTPGWRPASIFILWNSHIDQSHLARKHLQLLWRSVYSFCKFSTKNSEKCFWNEMILCFSWSYMIVNWIWYLGSGLLMSPWTLGDCGGHF